MVYWMILALSWIAGRTPHRPRLWVSGALGELVYLAWGSKRRVTVANMAQVLGLPASDPRVRAAARRSWRNYGRYTSDFFYLPNTTSEAIVARSLDITPAPGWRLLLDEAHAAGKGVLVATAHFGNWDAAGAIVAAHTPLHAIAETFPDPRLNELVQRQRAALNISVVPLERTPRRIMRILQEGGSVATPVDRPMPAGEGTPVTFFGRRCYVPGGFAQLALKTGATIIVGFAWYDETYTPTYYNYVAPPIVPRPTGDRQADTIALTQRIYDVIEEMVRQYPAQWYMFRPFWPDEPADATDAETPSGAQADAQTGAAAPVPARRTRTEDEPPAPAQGGEPL